MPLDSKMPGLKIRLYAVFACILLIVLSLPLSGVYFFRIYENELIRQTESELVTQGIFIAAAYRQEFQKTASFNPIVKTDLPARDTYHPFPPRLDLRRAAILPPRPDPVQASHPPDPVAADIGRRIMPMIQDAGASTLAGIRVLDIHGNVVSGTNETGVSLRHSDEVKTALRGQYASVLRQRVSSNPHPPLASISRGSNLRVFVAMPIKDHHRVIGAVYLSRSSRNILKALYDERESVLIAGFFILGITALIAWLLSHTIGRPIRALTRYARHLTSGDRPESGLASPMILEFASLTHSFEKMFSTLQARSEYIHNFAMHLAHEFKTPLTSIQGSLELLHDHSDDMTAEQRNRFMENIAQNASRLKKLISRLLELARADVAQPNRETVDIAPLLARLQKRYPVIQTRSDANDIRINIASDILETILVNLIENGIQHGASRITIDTAIDRNGVALDIADNGKGVSAGNIPKLFTPFFTTRRESGGTGLGLVITRSLLMAHNGSIHYIPGETGAHFRLAFVNTRSVSL